MQYIRCCPEDPVKLKIEITVRNKESKELSPCKKNFGDLEINVAQRPNLGIVFTS